MYCLCVNVYCTTATGCQPKLFCCFVVLVNSVVLCTVCVYICTVLLPPGVNPIAVNRYTIIYYISRRHKQLLDGLEERRECGKLRGSTRS